MPLLHLWTMTNNTLVGVRMAEILSTSQDVWDQQFHQGVNMAQKLSHQYVIELETEGPADTPLVHDQLEIMMLHRLRKMFETCGFAGFKTTVNVVTYEATYPTPNPEDL